MDCYPTPVNNNSSRKRNAESAKWKRTLAKKQRYSAKSLPKRLLCAHKKTFNCMTISMIDIKHFFDTFYAQPDKRKQDAIILKHCTPVTVKRRRRNNNSSYRNQTFQTKFYIYSKTEKKKVQVCQRFFLTILQITKYRVLSIMKEYYSSGNLLTENRGGDRVSIKYLAKREAIMAFINKIPCGEPHYCRGHTKRYLSSELSINKLWKMYNLEATDNLKVKKSYFRRIFNTKYNLSFGSPRTDVCATCLRFSKEMKVEKDVNVRQVLMTAQRLHKLKAKSFFDKVKEEKPGLKTFSFDCEKNLNLLKVPDQVAYYMRNVYLYNFTIVEGSSKSKLLPEIVFAYCWTEEKYPKAANEIASAIYHRLKNTDLSTISKIRLVAKGCAGQNKNTIMLAMLSKWLTQAPQNIKEIEFVFPVVGHSYIPPDRVFAQIEKEARKHEVINSPQKYLDIISQFSTVTTLGDECEVLDWKSASQEIFKPVGNWHFQFKLCKRFILKRSKRAGNVLIGGHLHYKTDDGVCKNVCKRGKLTSMLNPSKINVSCILPDAKKKNILTLLKSHWGNDWQKIKALSFFKYLLNVADCQFEETGDNGQLCELQEEIDDLHV